MLTYKQLLRATQINLERLASSLQVEPINDHELLVLAVFEALSKPTPKKTVTDPFWNMVNL